MVNKLIHDFINKMNTAVIENKVDGEIIRKRVVANIYPGFSEFIKTPLRAFSLILKAKTPPKLKTF